MCYIITEHEGFLELTVRKCL